LRAKIKKEEVIYLAVEDIVQSQIEQLRNLQGVIVITENNAEDLAPNQHGFCLKLNNIDELPSVFDFLFDQKIKLVNFRREEPTLEDAFIELTKRT
jgi:hypothetical protein